MDPLAFLFGVDNGHISADASSANASHTSSSSREHLSLGRDRDRDRDLDLDLDLDRLLQSTTVSPWTPAPTRNKKAQRLGSNSKSKWLCLANNKKNTMTTDSNGSNAAQGQGQADHGQDLDPILAAFLNDSALAQLPSISASAFSPSATDSLSLSMGLDLGLDLDAIEASASAATAAPDNTKACTTNINGLFPPSPPHSVLSGSLSPQRSADLDTPSPLTRPAVPPTSSASPPPLPGADQALAPTLPLSFPGFSWPGLAPFTTPPFTHPAGFHPNSSAPSTDPNSAAAAAAAAAAAMSMSMSMMFPPTSTFPPAWMPPPNSNGTTPLTPSAGSDFSFPTMFPSLWPATMTSSSSTTTPLGLPVTPSTAALTSLPSPSTSSAASRSVSPPSISSPSPGNTSSVTKPPYSAPAHKPAATTTKTAPSHKRTSSEAGNSPVPTSSSTGTEAGSDLHPMDVVDDLTPAAREAQALLTSRPKRRRRSAGQQGGGSGAEDDTHAATTDVLAATNPLLPRPSPGSDDSATSTPPASSAVALTPEEKKRIRMMKNRLAASESRKRHREHLDTLEATTQELVAENARLVAALRASQAQCAELATQVRTLTSTLELAQQDSKVKSFGAVFVLALVGVAWLVPVMWTSPVPPGVGLIVRPSAGDPSSARGARAAGKWGQPVGGIKWTGAGGQVLRTLGGQWHVDDPGSAMVPAAKHAGTLAGRVRAAARAVQWSIASKRSHNVPQLPEGPSAGSAASPVVEAAQGARVQKGPWASGAVALIDATSGGPVRVVASGQDDGVQPLAVLDAFADDDEDEGEGQLVQATVPQTMAHDP